MSNGSFDPAAIRSLASAIASEILSGQSKSGGERPAAKGSGAAGLGHGVYATIDEAVDAARRAFLAYDQMGLSRRFAIVEAVARSVGARVRRWRSSPTRRRG